jgi:3-hydroxy-9,10-secoandrosta-1,3,5(10)-triene-9,17-dione monooxygenase
MIQSAILQVLARRLEDVMSLFPPASADDALPREACHYLWIGAALRSAGHPRGARDTLRTSMTGASPVDPTRTDNIPSSAELVRRAHGLIPQLRAEQEENNQRGTYSQALHDKFREAGFYRICQPRRYGGFEHSVTTYYKVMVAIATGHPSAGWCLTLGASHAFTLASHWGEQAQDEAFATGLFIAPHRAIPSGTATRVNGGYRISGIWGYASGIPYSTHLMATTLVDVESSTPRSVNFIVPRNDYTILDDWGGDRTMGMRASGSNSAKLDDVFVPDHMIVDFPSFYARPEHMVDGTPGTQLHGNPMYLGRLMGPYHASLVAPVVGAARAALDEYEQTLIKQQTLFPPFVARKDHHDFQRIFGYAMTLTDSAESLLYAACNRYMDLCKEWQASGRLITVEDNLRLWAMIQQSGKLACDAVEMLFQSSGTTASRKGHPLAQYMGDAQMYRGHVSSQYLSFGNYVARAHLGLTVGLLDF